MRLDHYLVENFPKYSRSQIRKFIDGGLVLVNGKQVRSGYLLSGDDKVDFNERSVKPIEFKPENFDYKVVYEDDVCLVIDKPAGIVVHPGEGGKHMSGSLANALLDRIGGNFHDTLRPGIVHRLDKDTSGLLIVAKNPKASEDLISQFRAHQIKKFYSVLVFGRLSNPEGIIDAPIGRDKRNRKKMGVVDGSKQSITNFRLNRVYAFAGNFVSLLDVEIVSGRTHQIRVHFAAIGHPVVCDGLYGSKKLNCLFRESFGLGRQFLHASEISFKSPSTGKIVSLKSRLPADLYGAISRLELTVCR